MNPRKLLRAVQVLCKVVSKMEAVWIALDVCSDLERYYATDPLMQRLSASPHKVQQNQAAPNGDFFWRQKENDTPQSFAITANKRAEKTGSTR